MNKILLSLLILFTSGSFGQKIDSTSLRKKLAGYDCGFSIYDIKADKQIQYNAERCKIRYSPCSTFKIPNSLIGLETGVIPDTCFIIKYDSLLHPKIEEMLNNEPFKYWFQDLSLKSAFKYSCVWYYQELARRIGQERMKKYIDLIGYGNKDISSGIDNFWLCGSVEISINEQIDLLKKLYLHKLQCFSDTTIDAVKSIMLYESTSDYKLYGKTGSGDCLNNKVIGWYVGFVETKGDIYIFALNLTMNSYDDFKNNFRIELTKNILKDLKIIK